MKRRKMNLILKIISIIFLFQLTICPTSSNAGFFSDMFEQSKNFLESGTRMTVIDEGTGKEGEAIIVNEKNLKESSSKIFNILFIFGVALAVIVGGILGIQFMIASAEDKAKIKESMIPYICGCAIVFGAFGIWKLTVNIGSTIGESTTSQMQEVEMQKTRESNSKTIQDIENGNVKVSDLSNNELKNLYRTNNIDGDLNTKVNGLIRELQIKERENNKTFLLTDTKRKELVLQAIGQLSPVKQKIYNEASGRGLLSEDGIWLK